MAAKVLDSWALIAFFEGESAADAVEHVLQQAAEGRHRLFMKCHQLGRNLLQHNEGSIAAGRRKAGARAIVRGRNSKCLRARELRPIYALCTPKSQFAGGDRTFLSCSRYSMQAWLTKEAVVDRLRAEFMSQEPKIQPAQQVNGNGAFGIPKDIRTEKLPCNIGIQKCRQIVCGMFSRTWQKVAGVIENKRFSIGGAYADESKFLIEAGNGDLPWTE